MITNGFPKRVVYLGRDHKYFERYVESLEHIFNIKINRFILDYSVDTAAGLVYEIYKRSPDLIVVDFTQDPDKLTKVSFFLSRMYPLREIPFLGLLTGLRDNKDLIEKMVYTGINYLFYKLQEIEFSSIPTALIFNPDKSRFSEYFLKECQGIKAEITIPVKVGYVSMSHIHLETNANLPRDEFVDLDINIFKRKVSFKVQNHDMSNRYYHYRYCYDLNYEMPSQVKLLNLNQEEEKFRYLYENEVVEQQDNFSKEIQKMIEEYNILRKNNAKKLRILILDSYMRALKETKDQIDQFSFCLRLHQYLDQNGEILDEVFPRIIVYCLHDPIRGKKELDDIFMFINAVDNYDPFVLVFDEQDRFISQMEDKKLLAEKPELIKVPKRMSLDYDYDRFMPAQGAFQFHFLLKLIRNYKDKLLDGIIDDSNSAAYFSKKNPMSDGFINDTWELTKMCEAFIIFLPQIRVPHYTIVKAYINNIRVVLTVLPFPETYLGYQSDPLEQFAVISGVDEIQQGELRKIVNIKEKGEE